MEGGQGEKSRIRDRVRGKEVEARTKENSCGDFSGKGEQKNQEVVGRGTGKGSCLPQRLGDNGGLIWLLMGHSQQERDLPKPESCLQTGATQELAQQKLEDAVLEIHGYHLLCIYCVPGLVLGGP